MPKLHTFQYGNDPKHQIKLTLAQAAAANKIRIMPVEVNGETYYTTNLNPREMRHYNAATDILNAYLETHDVYYTDEDIAAGMPILQLIR